MLRGRVTSGASPRCFSCSASAVAVGAGGVTSSGAAFVVAVCLAGAVTVGSIAVHVARAI